MAFVRGVWMRRVAAGAAVVAAMGLTACSTPRLFGSKQSVPNPSSAAAVSVNGYLWRAALDTLSFMPLASADPFGGVIITDWYSPPETPDERFKMNIYILGRELRADGLRVAVFRQNHATDGRWTDAAVKPETGIDLENQILTRARQLRIATANR